MTSAPTTRPETIRNLQRSAIGHPRNAQHRRGVTIVPHVLLRLLRQSRPNLHHSRPPSREHAVLHAVEDAAVNGRHKTTRHQAEDDAGVEVMLAQTVRQLKVLIKHGAEGERNRLSNRQNLAMKRVVGDTYTEINVRHHSGLGTVSLRAGFDPLFAQLKVDATYIMSIPVAKATTSRTYPVIASNLSGAASTQTTENDSEKQGRYQEKP